MYLTTLFVAFKCNSLEQCMNLNIKLTENKILSLMEVRYIRRPMKLLKWDPSTFSVSSSLMNFSVWFIGVFIVFEFINQIYFKNLFCIFFDKWKPLFYIEWSTYLQKFIRPRLIISNTSFISCLNSSTSAKLLHVLKHH